MWNLLLWKLFTKHAPGSLWEPLQYLMQQQKQDYILWNQKQSPLFDGGCYMILIHVLLQWKHLKCGIIPKNVWQGIYIGTLDLASFDFIY